MLGGARRPDYLADACRALDQYLRLQRRMVKADPHLFGPRALDYFRDTLEMERQQREIQAAIRKVYGPGAPEHLSTLWTDRYSPHPRDRRKFLKWFHENYPST